MKTSKQGLEFIAKWEGTILKPYMDVASLWTIGVGHLIKNTDSFSTITNNQVKDLLKSTDKNHPVSKIQIPREEALDILSKDIAAIETALNNSIKVPLNQNQFDALVSFGFNCGPGVFRTSGACKSIANGDYTQFPIKLLDWSKVRTNGVLKTNQGLYNRRVAEGELFSRKPATIDDISRSTLISWTPDIIVAIQTKLKSLGLYPGLIDGISGPATRKAMEDFSRNYSAPPVPKMGITQVWLDALSKA